MLPKLYKTVKPASGEAQDSIGELVRFARDEVPASVWRQEFGDRAPWYLVERHEHHYHLHKHEYRDLSHHVYNVISWENETSMVCMPTGWGLFVFYFVVLYIIVLLI